MRYDDEAPVTNAEARYLWAMAILFTLLWAAMSIGAALGIRFV